MGAFPGGFFPGGGAGGPGSFGGPFGPGSAGRSMFPTAPPAGGLQYSSVDIGKGLRAIPPIDPGLTNALFSFLQGQIGKGATPYGGELSAPINDIIQQMSQTGMPVNQMPAWQAMVDAMQRQIQQGAGGIREQASFTGNLEGTPFAQSLTDYYSQVEKDLNAQLLGAETGALEAARGRQVSASEMVQTLEQQGLDRKLAEFLRTQPEYGPLLNMLYAAATQYPPVAAGTYGIGSAGALLSGAGSAAGGIADLVKILMSGRGGGTPSNVPIGEPIGG